MEGGGRRSGDQEQILVLEPFFPYQQSASLNFTLLIGFYCIPFRPHYLYSGLAFFHSRDPRARRTFCHRDAPLS
jgi:hypothetical protein